MQYKIQGEPLPVVICTLEAGEKMITEKGSMSWLRESIGKNVFRKVFISKHIHC